MEYKKSMSQKLRMPGRDYTRRGWYFVTLGSDYHKQIFGAVVKSEMRPNELGRLVEKCWAEIPSHYAHIELGAWQVMPNHFHGLVRITKSVGKGLGEVMNVFKGAVTREWRRGYPAAGGILRRCILLWQERAYLVAELLRCDMFRCGGARDKRAVYTRQS